MRILLERGTAYPSYGVPVDPEQFMAPDDAIHVLERDMLELPNEPGRALALRLFGPSRVNPKPGDAAAEDR